MENSLKMMAVGILMVCLLPLAALAQQQEWQSTSAMRGSGSAYSSQVTAVGAASVGSMATTTSSSASARVSRPRRVGEGESTGGDFNETGDPKTTSPDEGSPVGDAVLPLMLMALAFGGAVAFRRRKTA